MRRLLPVYLAVVVCLAGVAAGDVTVYPTSGFWEEFVYDSGPVKSEITAFGSGWRLFAQKLESAVPGPDGWQWQTSYVNGTLDLLGLGDIYETITGLELTNLNNNDDQGLPELFEITSSGVLSDGQPFTLFGRYDAAISGAPSVIPVSPDVLVIAELTEAELRVGADGPDVIEGCLDIKPGSWPNPLNPKSRGVLPVALAGLDDFDVHDVDISSLELVREGFDEGVSPIRYNFSNVVDGDCDWVHADLDDDDRDDINMKFRTQELVDALDLWDVAGEEVYLTLVGEFEDGSEFEAKDLVRILNPGDANHDRWVDAMDIATVALGWAPQARDKRWEDGDFDFDGDVDGSDLAVVALNWASGVNAVPEPATMALLAFGAVVGMVTKRK